MGRTTFVAMLYVMGAACVVIALADRAWGWAVGAVIFFAVARLARRQLQEEDDTERAPARIGFVGLAMIGMLVVMAFLFWLQFSA